MPHVHELYDFTSSAYIVHENKILLVHHKKLGVWIPPGGHIELDEDPLQTLWREITEETGLLATDLTLLNIEETKLNLVKSNKFSPLPTPFAMFVVDYDETSNHKHIDLCYLLTSTSNKVRVEQHAAHAIGWFDLKTLREKFKSGDMFDNSYQYCVYALGQIAKK